MYNINTNVVSKCQVVETVTSDSEEELSEPLRYRNFQHLAAVPDKSSMSSLDPNLSLPADCLINDSINMNKVHIPIVGYEIMEERAKFTVYKLRIENKVTGTSWYVFRRYTDFVRLCNRIRNVYPQIVQYLPRKRWLKNNFDPIFIEERINGLQTLVNEIVKVPELFSEKEIQDFFCLNEPPVYSDANEESRAMFEAFEETINTLKQQLFEREALIDTLQQKLHLQVIENEKLKELIRNPTLDSHEFQKEYGNNNQFMK